MVTDLDRDGGDPEDRDRLVRARFEQARSARLATIVSPALVAEHAARPLGDHSPALAAVLAALRQAPTAGKLALLFDPDDRTWRIMTLSGRPGVPHDIDRSEPYRDERSALHAVFLRRLADLGITVGEAEDP